MVAMTGAPPAELAVPAEEPMQLELPTVELQRQLPSGSVDCIAECITECIAECRVEASRAEPAEQTCRADS